MKMPDEPLSSSPPNLPNTEEQPPTSPAVGIEPLADNAFEVALTALIVREMGDRVAQIGARLDAIEAYLAKTSK